MASEQLIFNTPLVENELDNLIAEKNDLILHRIEPLRAGGLETRIARHFELQKKVEDACVNWISAAACFTEGDDKFLARVCLERVLKLTKNESVAKLASEQLEKLGE